MTDPKKTISRSTYLTALALFHLGHQASERADELARELEKVLEVPPDDLGSSHFSDELYSSGAASLDAALDRAGYVIVPPVHE